jgi:glycosyltransferase involved in cell wall biosynthesis
VTRRGLLRRWLAIAVLTAGYGTALVVAGLLPSPKPPRPDRRRGRVLVNGTFHNPNWFYAHLEPLAQCSDSEVILIADGHTGSIEGLTLIVPPPLACKLLSRAGAKFLWSLWYALRRRPDLYMGYAIFPAATTALLLGRLFRRPACFQVTSGPLEHEGGGYRAENRILSSLGKPSPWIEKLAQALTRRFELLIVRGGRAERYLREFGVESRIETITGSVDMPEECPPSRDFDLIFVGRLTERKRPDRFVRIVREVANRVPAVSAIMVGDGPDTAALTGQIRESGLEGNIELLGLRSDVLELNLRSRIFVLTSRWEGVSIAMLEAMAAGAIPAVSDVGDLRDVVRHGENGFVLAENDTNAFADTIVSLLGDDDRMSRLSMAARQTVYDRCSRQAIRLRWRDALSGIGVIDRNPAGAGPIPRRRTST